MFSESSEHFLFLPGQKLLLAGVTTRPAIQSVASGFVLETKSIEVVRKSGGCLVQGDPAVNRLLQDVKAC